MHSICPTQIILHALITLFWWEVPIMKLLIMQFSPLPCHLVQFRPKYLPQHPIIKHSQPMFYIQHTDQFTHPYKIAAYILIFSVIFLCDVPIGSFNYLHNAGHPYKICQSLLSRGRNILALYWSQWFSYQLHKTTIGPSPEPIKSTLSSASSCHILILLSPPHLASSFEVCFPTKILGEVPLTEEKLIHLDCAVQAYTVLINNKTWINPNLVKNKQEILREKSQWSNYHKTKTLIHLLISEQKGL